MDLLYCFKFDPDTGKITKYTIEEYKIVINRFTDRRTFYFNGYHAGRTEKHSQLKEEKLERFTTNCVWTFNPDLKHAIDIMTATLEEKACEAHKTFRRCLAMLNILENLNLKLGE